MGFTDYRTAGLVDTAPVMLGFQAAGAAPLVLGHTVRHPETVATAIRIGDPASGDKALRARDESGGRIESVTDEQVAVTPTWRGWRASSASPGERRIGGRRAHARRGRRDRPGGDDRVCSRATG